MPEPREPNSLAADQYHDPSARRQPGLVGALLGGLRALLPVVLVLAVLAVALAPRNILAPDIARPIPAPMGALPASGADFPESPLVPSRAEPPAAPLAERGQLSAPALPALAAPAGQETHPTPTAPPLAAAPLIPAEAPVPPGPSPTAAAPTPTPVPDPAVRPLAQPVAPPMLNSGRPPVRKPGSPDPAPTTEHFIVVDGDSGAVLFESRAHERIAPASLTKIMTAILAIEHGNLSDRVKVDVNASTMVDSTVMGLEPWFDVTFEDLLYGLILPSGNDAALALGRYVAGSDERFVRLMNEKARWLGLQSTHFTNPHGLDDPDHHSSPADMVAMARYAMQYPLFRQVVATRRYDISRSNIAYSLYNLNPLLGVYPGADGVKTGFTDNAGRSLVGSAVRDGHRVYVAFMQSEAGVAADGSLLLDWAFESFTW